MTRPRLDALPVPTIKVAIRRLGYNSAACCRQGAFAMSRTVVALLAADFSLSGEER
jgi:hypothetical protein